MGCIHGIILTRNITKLHQKSTRPEGLTMTNQSATFSENEQLRGLIEQLNSYITTYHGGEVEFVSFDGKVVKVRLGGACLGCPLSPVTLKGWVEGTVRQFFPEIEKVESVN
jgi:Fe-S cluster biogenesis protein NfuA